MERLYIPSCVQGLSLPFGNVCVERRFRSICLTVIQRDSYSFTLEMTPASDRSLSN